MKISVRIALSHIERQFQPKPTDAWLLAPADMPTLTSDAIDHLLAAYAASLAVSSGSETSFGEPIIPSTKTAPTIWAPVSGGRRGHPVLFPWSLAGEVQQLGANEGLNVLLARYPVHPVEADARSILEDLDTPDDYERLRRRDG
jgi:molybdenum cofactor cytidylyltransferase